MTPSSVRIGARGGAVRRLFGLRMLLACVAAQSGLNMTVCLAPASCSAPAAEAADKMREVVATLRVLWGEEFEPNYKKYVLGSPPIVVLIPRTEMIRIANGRFDGRSRDGDNTHGLTI